MNSRSMPAGRADVIYGLVIGALAVAFLVHTYSDRYDISQLFGDVSTVFFPRLLLWLIIALSIGLVVQGVRDRSGGRLEAVDVGRVALAFAAACATTAGIWYLGYLIAMPIGVFLTGLALGYPNKIILAATSVAATLIVWLALGYFARVALPTAHLF